MRTSWRFLSRLLHSSKRTAVLNPSSPFNVFINDNNGKFFSILEHTNQFRGFCSVHCSKRFVLLGLVSFDNSGSNQHHKYSSNRSKYFFFLPVCFILGFKCELGSNFVCVCVCMCAFFLIIIDFFTRAKQVKKIETTDEHR